MCKPKTPKIEKADPVAPPPPMIATPAAPVLNDTSRQGDTDAGAANKARKGRAALTIPLASTGTTGVNIPR
ncbi:hypothetical protein GOC72_18765 [Sinorhizobium medicae]|nr:hypothetical protein [Sinorhizobium medicae]